MKWSHLDTLGRPYAPYNNVDSGNGYEDEGNAQALVETIDFAVQLEGKEEAQGQANDVICDNVEQEPWRVEIDWRCFEYTPEYTWRPVCF